MLGLFSFVWQLGLFGRPLLVNVLLGAVVVLFFGCRQPLWIRVGCCWGGLVLHVYMVVGLWVHESLLFVGLECCLSGWLTPSGVPSCCCGSAGLVSWWFLPRLPPLGVEVALALQPRAPGLPELGRRTS